MLSARPKGNDVLEGPGEVVTAVRIDGLEETEGDPHIHGEDVEVSGEIAIKKGAENGACTQDGNFCGMRILCSESEGCRVLVMDFMDVFIQNASVQSLMSC